MRLNAGVATLRRLAALCEAHVKTHEAREAHEVDDEHLETSKILDDMDKILEKMDALDTEVDTGTNHADWLRAAETRLWGTPSLVRH